MEPPAFTAGPLTVRAAPGVSATLQLPPPSGTQPFLYEWSRAGASLDDRFTSSDDPSGVRLTVSAARTEDSGVYTLQATNAAGKDTARVRLEVAADEAPTGDDPPAFLRRLQDLTVKVGTRTRFLVEIVSSTECKVTWYRNERRLMEAERVSLVRDGTFWCADIAAVSVDDTGRWTCTAENAGGRASCSAHLNVLVPKAYKRPEFVEELRALLTEQGTVSLECKVVGVPTPVLRWFKDSREIKAGDVFALTANADDPTSLGTYTCEAVNCMGRAYSSSKVHVVGRGSREGSAKPIASGMTPESPPIFTKELEDKFVRISEPLALGCHVVVPPWPRSVVWYNKEGKVEPGDRYHVVEDGVGGYMLEVPSAEWPDEGEWKCVATSSGGRIGISSCYVSMEVPKNYRKPRFMENLQAVLTEEGLVSFECKVVGFPTPVLSWFKDGQELKPGDVYQLTGTNSLGSYCCIARNCMGQASSSAELTVEDIQNQLNEEEKLQLFSKNQAPKFIQGLKSVEAKIDEPFRFTIKVAIPPEPTVQWYRDDQPVDDSSRCHLAKEERGVFFLDIQSLEFLDQAEWKCVAVNDFGHSVTSCFLKLIIPRHYKKPRFLENLQAILSDEGAVNLECKVIGVPQPVLKWYKDGEELRPGDIHRIISGQDGTCCLGTYTCEAQNCMGIAASSASLLGFDDSMKAKTTKKKVEEQPLQRNVSLSTIHEERSSQMYDTPVGDITLDDKAEISFSFDGKEVSVSLYETPDLTEEDAIQIMEMYADQISENVTEHNVAELPPLRFVKETSTSGNLLMEAIIIDVSPEYFASPEEDLRTEADIEDISIADENGPPQLSLDQDIGGEDYLERTMDILSHEKADIVPKRLSRKKSDSQRSADDYFSLSMDQTLSEDKRDDDTQILSESFASARSLGKPKSKSSKPSLEEGQESSDITKTILVKDDVQKQTELETPVTKPKRERRSSRGSRRSSSGSEKSFGKSKEELSKPQMVTLEQVSTKPSMTDEEFKTKMTNVSSSLSKVINDVQIIERDIILKSELMSSAATASRSLEIISSLIKPLSEIHSIADAVRESALESKEVSSTLFSNLSQPLKVLQQSLTIVEKCIDVESDNKTLVKKTCVAFIEKCGEEVKRLMNEIVLVTDQDYLIIEQKTLTEINSLVNDMNNVIKFSADTIKTRNLLTEASEIKEGETSVEEKHLRDTQKAVFELKSPLNSLLHIVDTAEEGKIDDLTKIKSSEVILNDMSASVQDLQAALEQIESLSVKESTTSLHKYNTEIIETVMESVLKLRGSFEQLSVETKNEEDKELLKQALDSIKNNLNEISSHLVTIERNVGSFDILQSDNKLEMLQKMAQILISLENNLPRLESMSDVRTHMDVFHKNLTRVLENVIESNEASKYFTLMEICDAVNRLNSSIKSLDTDNLLALASINNTLRIIQDTFIKNVFDSELNCSILTNITDVLLSVQEALNHADEISIQLESEHIQDITSPVFEHSKANAIIEHIDHTIAVINTVKSVEMTEELKNILTPVLENISPVLVDLKSNIASAKPADIREEEHISDMSDIPSIVKTLATPLMEINQNLVILNQVIVENIQSFKENNDITLAIAEPLHELHTTLEILHQDVISQYGEDVPPYDVGVNIASAVQNLQSCMLMIQEQPGVEGVDEMSTLEDISGIKTTAETIPSDHLILPAAQQTAVELSVQHFSLEAAPTATAQALQALNEHITVLQTPEVVDALDTLSEVSDYSSLKSVALGLGELHAGLEEILHPLVMENSSDIANLINTSKLAAIAEPMQELQQSLSVLDISNIPIYEHILEIPTEKIHSVLESISSFKDYLGKCIQALFPAMETADKTIEISNKVEALRDVCENLKIVIETTKDISPGTPVKQEVITLEETVDSLLNVTDVSKGIQIQQVKAITEELYEKIMTVQEELIQYTPHTTEKLSEEAKLIQAIDEIESNIAVLEQYDFVDLSRASDITSCTTPTLAIEMESEPLVQMDDILQNAVNVLQDSAYETPLADLMILEDFFKTCKSEFTIIRLIISKPLSHKKIIRLIQEFNFLQNVMKNFKAKRSQLQLSDDIDGYLKIFFVEADGNMKIIRDSLLKVISTQSDILFKSPLEKLDNIQGHLVKILNNKESVNYVDIITKFVNAIEIAQPILLTTEINITKELTCPLEQSTTTDILPIVENLEEILKFAEEQAQSLTVNKENKEINDKIYSCLQKHQDYKDATGTGKHLIILKCLSECADILQATILEKTPLLYKKIENHALKEVLSEMLQPLQALHSQLSHIQEHVVSGTDEKSVSVDISSTESMIEVVSEIHKDIVQKIESGTTLVEKEDISLIKKADEEIHAIQETLKSLESVPGIKELQEIAKPIEKVEQSLQTIIAAEEKADVVENLSKAKMSELLQQINQYVELQEAVEVISTIIQNDEIQESVKKATELRDIINMQESKLISPDSQVDNKEKQVSLAVLLQNSLAVFNNQVLENVHELESRINPDILSQLTNATEELQNNLEAVISTDSLVVAPLDEESAEGKIVAVEIRSEEENIKVKTIQHITEPTSAIENKKDGDKQVEKVAISNAQITKLDLPNEAITVTTEISVSTVEIITTEKCEGDQAKAITEDSEAVSAVEADMKEVKTTDVSKTEKKELETVASVVLKQSIEDFITEDLSGSINKLSAVIDIEDLKQTVSIAKELRENIATIENIELSEEKSTELKIEKAKQNQLLHKLQNALSLIKEQMFDSFEQLESVFDTSKLQIVAKVTENLQNSLNTVVPLMISVELDENTLQEVVKTTDVKTQDQTIVASTSEEKSNVSEMKIKEEISTSELFIKSEEETLTDENLAHDSKQLEIEQARPIESSNLSIVEELAVAVSADENQSYTLKQSIDNLVNDDLTETLTNMSQVINVGELEQTVALAKELRENIAAEENSGLLESYNSAQLVSVKEKQGKLVQELQSALLIVQEQIFDNYQQLESVCENSKLQKVADITVHLQTQLATISSVCTDTKEKSFDSDSTIVPSVTVVPVIAQNELNTVENISSENENVAEDLLKDTIKERADQSISEQTATEVNNVDSAVSDKVVQVSGLPGLESSPAEIVNQIKENESLQGLVALSEANIVTPTTESEQPIYSSETELKQPSLETLLQCLDEYISETNEARRYLTNFDQSIQEAKHLHDCVNSEGKTRVKDKKIREKAVKLYDSLCLIVTELGCLSRKNINDFQLKNMYAVVECLQSALTALYGIEDVLTEKIKSKLAKTKTVKIIIADDESASLHNEIMNVAAKTIDEIIIESEVLAKNLNDHDTNISLQHVLDKIINQKDIDEYVVPVNESSLEILLTAKDFIKDLVQEAENICSNNLLSAREALTYGIIAPLVGSQDIAIQETVEIVNIEHNNTRSNNSQKAQNKEDTCVQFTCEVTDSKKRITTSDQQVNMTNDIHKTVTEENNRKHSDNISCNNDREDKILESVDLLQHIEAFISDDMVESIEELATASNMSDLKDTVNVARELLESIMIESQPIVLEDTINLRDKSQGQQVELKEKLNEALTTLQAKVFEATQESTPLISLDRLDQISEVVTHLKEDLNVATSVIDTVICDHVTESTREESIKQLENLLIEVSEKIDLSSGDKVPEDNETLRDSLDEVQTVIIKLKRDFDGANDTLNETLEDLECSVRSVQLQINEDSPPELLKEACATLQLLVNNVSVTNETTISECVVKDVALIDVLEKCSSETDQTVQLLEIATNVNIKSQTGLGDIISNLNKLRDTMKSLRSGFTGNADTLIEKGTDIIQSLDQIEDKVFSIEKEVDSAETLLSDIRDNIITAVHAVYSNISNMRSTISSTQKQYMFENYGQPSENFLRSIKNLSSFCNMVTEEVDKTKTKKLAKSLRNVLNHFEDIKFYINLDKTARLPSDAAFTKVVLEDLKSNIEVVSALESLSSVAKKKISNSLKCIEANLQNIEVRSTLEVKEKIPMFKIISSHILEVTNAMNSDQFKKLTATVKPEELEEVKLNKVNLENMASEEGIINIVAEHVETTQQVAIESISLAPAEKALQSDNETLKANEALENLPAIETKTETTVEINNVSHKINDAAIPISNQQIEGKVSDKPLEALEVEDPQALLRPVVEQKEQLDVVVSSDLQADKMKFEEAYIKQKCKLDESKETLAIKQISVHEETSENEKSEVKLKEEVDTCYERQVADTSVSNQEVQPGTSKQVLEGIVGPEVEAKEGRDETLELLDEKSLEEKGSTTKEKRIAFLDEGKQIEKIEKDRDLIEPEKLEKEKQSEETLEQETLEKEKTDTENREKFENVSLEKDKQDKERKKKKEKLQEEDQIQKENSEKEIKEKQQFEQERLENEKSEKEKKDQLEKEILENIKLEKRDHFQKEGSENEKLEKPDKPEIEKKEKEKLDQLEKGTHVSERLEKPKLETEQQKQLDEERIEKEKISKEKQEHLSGNDRLEKEILEKEKQEIEAANIEQAYGGLAKEQKTQEVFKKERLENEKQEQVEEEKQELLKKERFEKEQQEQVEKERLEKEKQELLEKSRSEKEKQELLEKEILEKDKQEQVEKERLGKEKQELLEKEILEKGKQELLEKKRLDKLKQEQVEKERLEKDKQEQFEKERLEKEKQELLERERLEKEKQEQVEKENQELLDKERLEKEKQELLEKEKLEKETQEQLEKERLEQEKQELLEKEGLEKEKQELLEKENQELLDKERLEKEKQELLEKEKLEKEKQEQLEKERLEKEKQELLEKERLEKEKQEQLEKERLEKEKQEVLEKERLEKEKQEQVEKERLENEKQEQLEKERLEKDKQELLDKERLEKEKQQQVEKERLKKEKQELLEKERLEKEKQELFEKERLEKEKQEQLEKEKLEKEKQELLEKERLEKEKQEQVEKERLENEKQEQLEKERLEKDKQELLDKERLEKEKQELLEKERLEKEKQEQIEKERLEKEKQELFEKERLEKEKQEQLEKEKLEKEKQELLEKERLEKEKQEQVEKERLENEKKELLEKKRLEKEKQEQLEKERLEKERQKLLEKERLEKEKQQQQLEKERLEKEKQEQVEEERLANEKQEQLKKERYEKEEQELLEKERLEKEKQELLEKERLEKEKQEQVEKDRLEKEKQELHEKERLEKEKQQQVEKERLEKEMQELCERERLEKRKQELLEKDRLVKEKQELLEKERLEKEKQEQFEKERSEKKKQELLKKERLEKEKEEQVENERLENEKQEQLEKDRLEKEKKELLGKEKLEKEKQQQLEKERLEKEKKELLGKEKLEKEKQQQLEKERLEKEKQELLEKERSEKEKQELLEKARFEKKKQELLEKERLEKEKQEQLEKERLERENQELLEKERLEKEKQQQVEKERLKKEKQELLEKERLEKEKQEQLEKERLERENQELLEKERLEKEKQQQVGKERLKKEKQELLEKERLEKEKQEQLEKERLEKEENERLERKRSEKEKLEKKKLRKEKLEKEKMEREQKEKEKSEKEKQEQEKLRKEKLEIEKLEIERIENEKKLEVEKLQQEKAEKENLEKERQEREKLEKERLERENQEKELVEKDKIDKIAHEKEKLEREILEKQKENLELEKLEVEKRKKEQQQKEKLARERLEKEKREKEEKERQEKEQLEMETLEKEKRERELQEKEKMENDKLLKEKEENEKQAKEKLEKEKLAKEKQEKEKLKKNKLAKDKLAKERQEKDNKEKEKLAKEMEKKEKQHKEIEQEKAKLESEVLVAKGKQEKENLENKQRSGEKQDQDKKGNNRAEKKRSEKDRAKTEDEINHRREVKKNDAPSKDNGDIGDIRRRKRYGETVNERDSISKADEDESSTHKKMDERQDNYEDIQKEDKHLTGMSQIKVLGEKEVRSRELSNEIDYSRKLKSETKLLLKDFKTTEESHRHIKEYQYEPTSRPKYDDKEKPRFIDHNHRDYTMEFARPSAYREKTFEVENISFEKNTGRGHIYKANSLMMDAQLRSSAPPRAAPDTNRCSEPTERRPEVKQRSKAVSEARTILSEKRTPSRDIRRKPVFSTYLTDRTAVEGSRVKLTCSVLSSADPKVTWYKNGVLLDNKLKYRTKLTDGLITLEVLNAVPSDSAEYSCTVENENGSVNTSANLKVYPSFEASPIPPTFTRSIRDTFHLAENELVLECRIRGQPLPTITWLKDDRLIGSNERYQAYYLADGVCRLAINHPTPEDSGKYTCKAENSVWSDQITHVVNFTGKESRLSPNLTTIERSRFNRQALESSRRPHFGNVLTDYKVTRGGTIGLQVEIRGAPTRVEWLREGRSVTETYTNARTYVEQGLYTLALSDVTERESGLYTCRAWSSHGTVDMNAAITVVQPNELEGKPAIIAGRPEKDVLISVGEDLNISFRAQGEPKPKVILMKGIRDITTSQRVCKMTSDDYVKFTVKRSVVSDAGTYCVLARNAYGCDRAFVTVVVRQRASSENLISDWTYPMDDSALSITERKYKSVPDRIPGEPAVVDGGSNWVSLAWQKPEPSDSAPVLAYKVESWLAGKEGGARWTELGITPLNSFDAFNLKQGEEYHFRVTPRNRYGWGEPVQTGSPVGVGLAGDRPEFLDILPGQLKVLIGETANLSCSVKGNPTPEVVWMKNGHEIEEAGTRVKSSYNGFNCNLTIEGIGAEDEARYSCEATNVHGRASTYARLAVVTDRLIWEADVKLKRERSADAAGEYPPQFTMRLRDRRVQATYPVRLTCQVVGSPPPTVTWFKDGEEVRIDGRRSLSQDEHFHTLEIAPTTLEDGGVYEAMARNGSGAISCHCNLVVDKGIRAYVAPEFCCGLEPLYRLLEGEELRISAVVEAYPTVGVTWYRDGVRLRPSRRAIMTLDRDGQIELALAFVTPRDAGVYSCTASNEVGRATTSGKVEVVGDATVAKKKTPPMVVSPDVPYSKEPMFTRKPRSSEAREGDTVIIQCEVVGDPKPDVYWLRDFLKPDYYRDATHFKRVGDGPEYRFEIPHAKLDYTGAYSVVARNAHGEAKAIISLQILARDPSSTEEHNVRYGRVDVIPRFEKELTDLLCHDGDAIEFECHVSGHPEPDIRWFHYSELIRECPDFEWSLEDGAARLKIKQVNAEDEGTYLCEASNSLGKATTSACLVVYPPGEPNTLSQRLRRPPALLSAASTPRSTPRSTPARSVSRTPGPDPRRLCSPSRQMPPKFYTYPFNKVVEEGDHVVFQCAVKGLPAPWATWDKDGVIITPSSRITIREKDEILRILEIEEVTVEDVGIYRVTLENDYGRVEASARLEVITQKGKFYAGVRAYSASPRKALPYRRRSSSSRQD